MQRHVILLLFLFQSSIIHHEEIHWNYRNEASFTQSTAVVVNASLVILGSSPVILLLLSLHHCDFPLSDNSRIQVIDSAKTD